MGFQRGNSEVHIDQNTNNNDDGSKKNPSRLQLKNCLKQVDNWSLKNIEIDIGVIVFCEGGI